MSKNRPPKGLLSLLAAVAAAGSIADVIAVPMDPSLEFENDVRGIDARTYAEIMSRPEFTRDERDLATIMFHRSGLELFTHKVIGFSLDCTDVQFERLRGAFPEECRLAAIVRDREGRFVQFMDRVTSLDKFIRSSPAVGRKVEDGEARRPDPRDN